MIQESRAISLLVVATSFLQMICNYFDVIDLASSASLICPSYFQLHQHHIFMSPRSVRTNMENAQTFHFLDLPKEIRFTIYECFPITTTHNTIGFEARKYYTNRDKAQQEQKLVSHTLPGLAISRTCRDIYTEASAIIRRSLTSISSKPIQFITNLTSLHTERQVTILLNMSFSDGSHRSRNLRHLLDPKP